VQQRILRPGDSAPSPSTPSKNQKESEAEEQDSLVDGGRGSAWALVLSVGLVGV